MMSWLRKGKKTATGAARRITGISTPLGGVQLAPPAPKPDTSFGRAQDERELMDEIWLLAVSEAYGAKDGARRMGEMAGRSRLDVIEMYFDENPEVKRWVDRNMKVGTCSAAVSELREKEQRYKQWQQERCGMPPPQGRDPAFEWLHQAARGTAAKRGE
jgi:hypothetical protein